MADKFDANDLVPWVIKGALVLGTLALLKWLELLSFTVTLGL